MNKPLVSVCILTYMHQKYIEDCLKSVFNQTYENIEIIMLDDGSTDKTFEILKKYRNIFKKKYSRVILKQNKTNTANISQNTNWLIHLAQGEYIKSLSGDDIMRQDCLQQMVYYMESHLDKVLCYANTYVVDDDFHYGDKPGKQYFFNNHKAYSQREIFPQLMKLCYLSPAILVRKSAYLKYGDYDETIYYEDYDMWLRMGKNEEFLYLPQKLEYYRRSAHSKTNYKTEGGKQRFVWMAKEEQKVIKKHLSGLKKEEKRKYIGYFFDRFIWAAKNAKLWRFAIGLALRKKYECNR